MTTCVFVKEVTLERTVRPVSMPMAFCIKGGREGDPGTRKILVSGFTCRRFGPCGHQVEEELKTCNFVRNRQFFGSW